MTTPEFKKRLALVFDDDLRTRSLKWNNYVDLVIIGVILIGTVSTLISTFPLSHSAERWIKVIDWFVLIFFTIEVSLRIWAADEIDPKYKGFMGRVRYCMSFYGLVDVLATYPLWLAVFCPSIAMGSKLIQILRILRIARLIHVFRYMKAFRFMGSAISNKKREMLVSLVFITVMTVILSFVLYLVEHDTNPEMISDGWKAIVWSFAKYIGDPGKVADMPIYTTTGNIIAFLIGIMGIAIFAVPIGLLSSGFSEAVEEEHKEEERTENLGKLRTIFTRRQDRPTKIQAVPQFISLMDIKVKTNMTEEDILEAVDKGEGFRVINLASTLPSEGLPQDRLAVEHFPVNRSYGCCFDRGSKVTVVSTSSYNDALVGNFAYYLAKMGGFNYVSREKGGISDGSFYIPSSEDIPGYSDFKADIERLASKEGAWTVTILAASGAQEPEYPEEFHFGYGAKKGEPSLGGEGLTIHDPVRAEQVFSSLEEMLSSRFGIKSERQMRHSSSGPKLYLRHLARASEINSFILRIAWSAMAWNPERLLIAKEMAEILHRDLDPENPREDLTFLKTKDTGFEKYGDPE